MVYLAEGAVEFSVDADPQQGGWTVTHRIQLMGRNIAPGLSANDTSCSRQTAHLYSSPYLSPA